MVRVRKLRLCNLFLDRWGQTSPLIVTKLRLILQEEETAVIVVAGNWECSDSGIWDFFIAKECYARTILLRWGMSYEELVSNIESEFQLGELSFRPKLSYWPPCQLSIFSVNRRPPVIITTTLGLRSFLTIRRSSVHVNMLLSLESPSVGVGRIGMRQPCVDAIQPINAEEEVGNPANQRSNDVEAVGNPANQTSNDVHASGGMPGCGVRRRLFGVASEKGKGVIIEEGGCSSSQKHMHSVGEGQRY